ARTTVRLGLALIIMGSPVCGLRPWRALVASFSTRLILSRPGTVKTPGPFLPISLWMSVTSSSKTVAICLRLCDVLVASSVKMAVFVAALALALLMDFALINLMLRGHPRSSIRGQSRASRGSCQPHLSKKPDFSRFSRERARETLEKVPFRRLHGV